ncbi:hemerythrin domain-containing protein [Cupriavidus sp. UYPR2.512]|uniref:hemerythrin domain-containing protein n=1 Tax=Cupriavidus sp. UYPR2.512 TaxID=1080187 RepID=UPI000380E1AC|nr:hemerythrin domain-containing protein [Cupriavidus sp. UYPR2.512]UIF91215.1 hemerythrin domain-containing protein [Cupriavidus necator]
MANPLAVWHTDHIHFARLLDLLEQQVSAFHREEPPNYGLMGTIIGYLRKYGDLVHHPREDVAYALIVDREPGMRIVLSRLLQEHRVIATVGEELLNRLHEAENEIVTSRTALEAAAAMYLVYYRNHLFTEEKQVMPRAAQLLTEEDWAEIAATDPASSDPLFGANVEERFSTLRQQIDAEAKA